MKAPAITVRWDAESETFVSYIPCLDVYSAGTTEQEAIGAVYGAAALGFQYLMECVGK